MAFLSSISSAICLAVVVVHHFLRMCWMIIVAFLVSVLLFHRSRRTMHLFSQSQSSRAIPMHPPCPKSATHTTQQPPPPPPPPPHGAPPVCLSSSLPYAFLCMISLKIRDLLITIPRRFGPGNLIASLLLALFLLAASATGGRLLAAPAEPSAGGRRRA